MKFFAPAGAVSDPHAPVPADIGQRPYPPGGVPGQQDRRAAQVDGAEGLRPGQPAGQAEDERPVLKEDLDFLLVVLRRVAVCAEFRHIVGEIGRATLDMAEQPACEPALQGFPVHR